MPAPLQLSLCPLPYQSIHQDNFEATHWFVHAGFAGEEIAHLHPFRTKLLRASKLAGFANVEDFRQRIDGFPLLVGMRQAGACVSDDGQHHWMHNDCCVTTFFATMALASPDSVDLRYLQTLPSAGSCFTFVSCMDITRDRTQNRPPTIAHSSATLPT